MYIVTFENIVEETVSQEFTLKHIDEARNRAKEIDKQEAQTGHMETFTNAIPGADLTYIFI